MQHGEPELLTAVSRLVVLSPHLDDATLSCGALMAGAAGAGVGAVAVTIFNGKPRDRLSAAAREFHARCGHGDDAMTHREAEDDLAMKRLGVTSIRLGLPEALYRENASGGHSYSDGQAIFHSRPEAEPEVVSMVTQRITEMPAVRAADLLLAPLAIGDHIDHQIVAESARRLEQPVLWYEDIPYALYERCQGWEAALGPSGPVIYPAGARQWQAKLDAIDCYPSQHTVLWYCPETRHEVITTYGISVGGCAPGERYWRSRPFKSRASCQHRSTGR